MENNVRCTYCKNYTVLWCEEANCYICLHCRNHFDHPLPDYDYRAHYKEYMIYYDDFQYVNVEKDGKFIWSRLDRRQKLTREEMIAEAKQFIDKREENVQKTQNTKTK